MKVLITNDGYVCPICNSLIDVSSAQNNYTCPGCNELLGTTYYSSGTSKTTFLCSYKIIEKEDKIQVLATYCKKHATDTTVWVKYYNCCWIFNVATGLSYAMPVRNDTTKRPIRVKHNGFCNITYSLSSRDFYNCFTVCDNAKANEMYKEIIKAIAKKRGQEYSDFEQHYCFYEVCRFNRFPDFFDNRDAINFFFDSRLDKSRLLLRRYWGKKTPQEMSKIFKFPYVPSVLRRIASNPKAVLFFATFNSLKIDNAVKVYDLLEQPGNRISEDVPSLYLEFIKLFEDENVGVNKLLRFLKPEQQNNIGREIFYSRGTLFLFNDSIRMLLRVRHIPLLNLSKLLKEKDIYKLHDKLIKISSSIGSIDVPFNNEKELSKEGQVQDLIFSIPSSTNELIVIGNLMNICVGSYGERVLQGYSKIAYAHRDNKLVACIEYKNDLIQVKGYSNALLSEADQKKVLSWAKHNKISRGCTYDITTKLTKELPFTSTHQAMEGIRDFTGISSEYPAYVPF